MIKKVVYAILLILAFALQETWVPLLAFKGAVPDLTLFFVIFTGLLKTPLWGLGAGVLIGFIQDLLSGKYIGLNILAKGAAGFIVPYFCLKFYKDNYLIPLISVLAGTLIYGAVYIVGANIVGLRLPFLPSIWQIYLPKSLFNVILTPFLYVGVYLYFIQYAPKSKEND
jgi:rod shape-determining protein MreD